MGIYCKKTRHIICHGCPNIIHVKQFFSFGFKCCSKQRIFDKNLAFDTFVCLLVANLTISKVSFYNFTVGIFLLDNLAVSNLSLNNFIQGNSIFNNFTLGNFTLGNLTLGNPWLIYAYVYHGLTYSGYLTLRKHSAMI